MQVDINAVVGRGVQRGHYSYPHTIECIPHIVLAATNPRIKCIQGVRGRFLCYLSNTTDWVANCKNVINNRHRIACIRRRYKEEVGAR